MKPTLPVETRPVTRLVVAVCGWLLLALAHAHGTVAPSAPSHVRVGVSRVNAFNPERQLFHVSWRDNSLNATYFLVQARVGTTGSFVNLSLSGTNEAGITLSQVFPVGTQMFFRVVAVNDPTPQSEATRLNGDEAFSAPSAAASVVIPAATTFGAPTNLTATITGDGLIRLAWTDNSTTEEVFEVQSKLETEPESAYTTLTALFAERNPFEGSLRLRPSLTYHLRIRALKGSNGSGGYAQSTPFSNTVTVAVPPLATPTNLTVTKINDVTVRLTWKDNSHNEGPFVSDAPSTYVQGGYVILRQVGSEASHTPAYIVAENTQSSDVPVPPGTAVSWRVMARWTNGTNSVDSAPSSAVSLTTEFKAPTELTAAPAGPSENPGMTRVHLTWKDNSSVEGGYQVEYRHDPTNPDSVFTSAGYFPQNATQATIDVPVGAAADVRVRAAYSFGGTIFTSAATPAKRVQVPNGLTGATSHPATKGIPITPYTVTVGSSPARSSWYLQSGPDWISFDSDSGTLNGTPTEAGIQKAVIHATFTDGNTDTHEITFRVQEPEAPPLVSFNPSSRTIPHNQTVSLPLSEIFKDPDSPSAVRVTTNYNSNSHFDIILQNELTPQTVANFMSYVNAGDYNGVAIHRAVPGFVVQMGGYKKDGATGINFNSVTARPSPLNEPGISNLRRTVAMAKRGGDPNSATHDFFVSIADNTSNLDAQNGGFTVFGRVPEAQMTLPDSLAALVSIYNADSDFYRISLPADSNTRADQTFQNWPLTGTNDNPSLGTLQDEQQVPRNVRDIDKSKLIEVTSVTPIPVLAIGDPSNTNPDDVAVAVNGNNLDLTGLNNFGTSTISISATDLDGNVSTYSFDVTVDSTYTKVNITTHPAPHTVAAGNSHTFNVVATGTDLAYQWRKNGIDIPGAHTSSLHIPAATIEDQGSYQVVVSNAANFVVSTSAVLTVNAPPIITREPVSRTLSYDSAATFIVAAKGSATLTYQWRKNGINIAGANSPSYTIAPIKMTDAGAYTCVVTNTHGSDTSAIATLTVTPTDQDADGVPDHEEVALGTDRFKTDTDDDGYTDGQEVTYGSDPKSASSTPAATIVLAKVERANILRNIAMRKIPAKTGFNNALTGSTVDIPEMWLSTYELSNAEWAAILQHAWEVMSGVVNLVPNGPDKEIHSRGNLVCRIPTHKATDPGNLGVNEVTLSDDQTTFQVSRAVADHPARGITWFGAFLAAEVLNHFNGYNSKTDTVNLSFNFETPDGMGGFVPVNGFHIPRYYEWEHAARSNTATQLYATGPTISGTRANYDASALGKPRPVSSYLPNAGIGCFNLAGNVSEWIFETDVNTPGHGFTRGGGYDDPESDLQNDARKSRARNAIHPSTGIRLALVDKRAPTSPSHPTANVIVKTGSPILLAGNAIGAPPLLFQWYRDGKALPGRTSRTLNIPSATLADGGRYKLEIRNGLGKITTNESLVTVVESVPKTIYAKLGTTATLTAKTRGPSTLQFRWRKDELPLSNDRLTTGVTTRTLKTYGPTIAATGYYDCQVTGPGSSGTVLTGETLVVFVSKPRLLLPETIPAVAVGGSLSLLQRYQKNGGLEFTPTRWTITGLPPGMTYDPLTGTITGRATKPGVYIVTVVASNAAGSSSPVRYALTVEAFPVRSTGHFVGSVAAGVTADDDIGGRIELTTTATGSFTGSIWINSIRYPISGVLNTDAISTAAGAPTAKSRATLTITRGNTLPALQLALVLDPATDGLTGTLGPIIPPATEPVEDSKVAITGWRNVWGASNPATARAGRQNVRFSIPASDLNDPAIPQGDGFASLTVAPGGGTTLNGRAADGSLIVFSSHLGPNGQVLLYQTPYGSNGSLLGTLIVGDTTQVVSGNVRWYKKNLGPTSIEKNYKDGFGPLELTAQGQRYTAPTSSQIVVNFPNLSDNARLTLSPLRLNAGGTELEDSVTNLFRINLGHSVSLPPASPALTIQEIRTNPGSGTFTGRVSLTDVGESVTRDATIQGIFIPSGVPGTPGFGTGYVLLPHLPGTPAEPILSSRVSIIKQP